MNQVSRSKPRRLAAVALGAIAFSAMANAEPKSLNGLPASSSPIAITSDDRFVWVVNPDNNSVSVISVSADENRKVAEISVGEEPRFVAITPKDHRVSVSNSRDGSVSMISPSARRVLQTTSVGTEPAGLAATPGGSALTLDEVLNSVTHRSAGTEGVDTLSNSDDRQALVGFLKSIDEATPPIP